MSANLIQASYTDLAAIAGRFAQQNEATAALEQQIARSAEALADGGWIGRGANAFFAELEGEIIPAIQRLQQAFEVARISTSEAIGRLREAEEEAARLFHGQIEGQVGGLSTDINAVQTSAGADDALGDGSSRASRTRRRQRSQNRQLPETIDDIRREHPFSYSVSDPISILGQPSRSSCWAAAATMLSSWHDRRSYTISEVVGRAGTNYLQHFEAVSLPEQRTLGRRDQTTTSAGGLRAAEERDFFQRLGLQAVTPTSTPTPQDLRQMLQDHGPFIVATDENAQRAGGRHARIIVGVIGDGTFEGTVVQIVDPWTRTRPNGTPYHRYEERYGDFADKFEELVRPRQRGAPPPAERPQIFYFSDS